MKKSLFLLFLLVLSCSDDPVEIFPVMDVGSLLTGTKAAITEFVFLAVPASSSDAVFFPSNCLQTGSDGKPCIPSAGCGDFSSGDVNFKLSLALSIFPNGKSLTLIACGIDGGQNILAYGSGAIINSKGETVNISMDETDIPGSDCTLNLPDKC